MPKRGRHARPNRLLPFVIGAAVLVVAGGAAVAATQLIGRSAPVANAAAERPTGASKAAKPAAHRSNVAASPRSAPSTGSSDSPWLRPPRPGVVGHLQPGSHPGALPGMLLIADKLNNRLLIVDPHGRIRWMFPRPGDLAPGQTFRVPDDAFFSPNGKDIVATEEDESVISVINVAEHRIVYRYGVPGHPGSSRNHLSNPDDAMLLPDGRIITADIKNCRLLLVSPPAHRPQRVIGRTTSACRHAPPHHWGSPNGAFPLRDGNFLITEINGDWVDEMTLRGKVLWSTHPPGVRYPSDSNQIGPNRYVTVDYSSPGQVVIFNRHGRCLWRWHGPRGHPLNHPSLALPLPNGDIALNDDYNHRVLIVNPRTRRVVWQYGVTGKRGRRPGYLNNPDGIDLVPPNSLVASG